MKLPTVGRSLGKLFLKARIFFRGALCYQRRFVFLVFMAELYLIFLIIAGLPAEITVVVIVGIAYAIYYNQRMLRNARDAEKRRLNRPATSETPSQETPPQGSGSA